MDDGCGDGVRNNIVDCGVSEIRDGRDDTGWLDERVDGNSSSTLRRLVPRSSSIPAGCFRLDPGK